MFFKTLDEMKKNSPKNTKCTRKKKDFLSEMY